MSNNNSNVSIPNNNNNVSMPTTSGQSGSSDSSGSSVSTLVPVPILSLTILFAIAYTILVLVRPTFRANKLNWFIINVCITSAFLSCIMLSTSIMKIMNVSSSLSCRAQGFLPAMGASQMMYSHSVVAFSRLLTIVYSTKRLFRSNACIWSCIVVGWVIAFLVAIPYLLVDAFTCSSSTRAAFLPYYTLVSILMVPVTIVLICNIRILLFVQRSSRRVHTEDGGNHISHARDVRLIKTMIVTFAVFVGGWGPLFVEQSFSDRIKISTTTDAIFQILPPVSMLCDVILLIYTNQPIRLFLWQLIVKRRQIIPNNMLGKTIKTNVHTIYKH